MKEFLTKEQVQAISSDYLNQGRKSESWIINSVSIEGEFLEADISMTETFISDTDRAGFHLTIFSSLEFLSQLMIIYGHHWAGFTAKSKEGWMVESSIKCNGSIRSTSFKVQMDVLKMRRRIDTLYCHADFIITDSTKNDTGSFKASLKGFLS